MNGVEEMSTNEKENTASVDDDVRRYPILQRYENGVRLALTLLPIVARSKVITVPIVAPNTMYIALWNSNAPEATIATVMPMEAELDCNNAVIRAPIKTSSGGKYEKASMPKNC